jgi:hypothetical protein
MRNRGNASEKSKPGSGGAIQVSGNGAPRRHSGGLYYRARAVDDAGRWTDCMPGKPAQR